MVPTVNVVNYTGRQISNFAINYLRKNEKVRETVFACSYGAQVQSFKQNNGRKSRDIVPLTWVEKLIENKKKHVKPHAALAQWVK